MAIIDAKKRVWLIVLGLPFILLKLILIEQDTSHRCF